MRRKHEVVTDLESGVVLRDAYYLGLKLHRDETEGPALTRRNAKGQLLVEEYYRTGILHRESGPARTVRRSARDTRQEWYRDGKIHRPTNEGPAVIQVNPENGVVFLEVFCVNGKQHRDDETDLPAYIQRRSDGRFVLCEAYSSDGKSHRDPVSGPADIHYDHKTGLVKYEAYYVRGAAVPQPPGPPRSLKFPGPKFG